MMPAGIAHSYWNCVFPHGPNGVPSGMQALNRHSPENFRAKRH